MSVTRFGVSLLKVVATMDKPASHHGTARPETKNSDVLLPARLPKNSDGAKQMIRVMMTTTQSRACRCMSSPSVRADPCGPLDFDDAVYRLERFEHLLEVLHVADLDG